MTKQGRAMTNKANKLKGNVNVGDVVQILLSNVNVSKVDIKNLTLVIVEKIQYPKKLLVFCLVNKHYVMKDLYYISSIKHLKGTDWDLLELESCYQN